MEPAELNDFARRYAAAWCSQDAARVAGFFSPTGSLRINSGEPSVGRAAITASAQGFMTAFPDLTVSFDELAIEGTAVIFHWTLTGTDTSTGRPVRISGYEQWRLGDDGLVVESQGHFDAADYHRQLAG